MCLDSIHDYLRENNSLIHDDQIETATIFDDSYTGGGYARENTEIEETIKEVLKRYGIPLDPVYTGKAFHGMVHYIRNHGITEKKVLFLHTGGTPLFFDEISRSSFHEK